MIRHQTVDMAKHIDPVQRQSEDGQDRLSTEVIEEDRGLCVAAGRHKIFYTPARSPEINQD